MAARGRCNMLFIALFSASFSALVFAASLYDASDPLRQLDSSNFTQVLTGKNNAWIVEFYALWCGHCIKFAPEWKKFARDVENWRNVIDVAVVNCADNINVELCRTYQVASYPTIKLFPANIDQNENGHLLEVEKRDVISIRHAVIKFLESQPSSAVPAGWPTLKPLEVSTVKEIWEKEPSTASTVYLFVENPGSVIGKEIILDLSSKKLVTVKRIETSSNALLNELAPESDNTSLLLLKVEKNGAKDLLLNLPADTNNTYIRDKVFEVITGETRKHDHKENRPVDDTKDPESHKKAVHIVDLDNAVHYALRQEVGVHSDMTKEEIRALKSFLSILKMYFPGNGTTMNFLVKLHDWVKEREDNLTGEMFLHTLDEFTTDKEFLPEMREWVGCKGSKSFYRGYPCSLWMLFHTLTVRAYVTSKSSHGRPDMREDPKKAIFAIHDYVKYFFSCKYCSKHFQEMAKNLKQEVQEPEDVALWLWKGHNKVNKRLVGDPSEDPKHKKVQFPTVSECQKCRNSSESSNNDIQWDSKEVLQYLQRFYENPDNSGANGLRGFSYLTVLLVILYIMKQNR